MLWKNLPPKSGDDSDVVVIDIDSNPDSDRGVDRAIDNPKKVVKRKRKPIVCRDISTFMTGHKRAAVESDKLVAMKNNFQKKKETL